MGTASDGDCICQKVQWAHINGDALLMQLYSWHIRGSRRSNPSLRTPVISATSAGLEPLAGGGGGGWTGTPAPNTGCGQQCCKSDEQKHSGVVHSRPLSQNESILGSERRAWQHQWVTEITSDSVQQLMRAFATANQKVITFCQAGFQQSSGISAGTTCQLVTWVGAGVAGTFGSARAARIGEAVGAGVLTGAGVTTAIGAGAAATGAAVWAAAATGSSVGAPVGAGVAAAAGAGAAEAVGTGVGAAVISGVATDAADGAAVGAVAKGMASAPVGGKVVGRLAVGTLSGCGAGTGSGRIRNGGGGGGGGGTAAVDTGLNCPPWTSVLPVCGRSFNNAVNAGTFVFQHVVLPGSSARHLFHMSAFSSEPGQALLTSLFIKAFPYHWSSTSTKLSPWLQELSRQRANTHALHLAAASSRAGWVGAPGAPAAAVQRRQTTLPHCCLRLRYVRRRPAPPGRRRSCAPAMPAIHMYLSSRGRRAQNTR